MRRAWVVGLALLALAGCSSSVRGAAAPAEPAAASTTAAPSGSLPGGATPTCLVADGCDDDKGATPAPVGLACAPLPDAMSSFDAQARAVEGGSGVGLPAAGSEESALAGIVFQVVDVCGYQVMVDVANQYPQPLYGWLRATAVTGLGSIGALPDGLRCADLRALGWGPKQAVDYWFFWNAPALMDADSNGVPCETVWADVARYMPAYY
jgi:hypothetical protein